LLSAPAARLSDGCWASEASTDNAQEDGWETARELDFCYALPHLAVVLAQREDEPWPTLAEEGDHLYLEAAVSYAEKQELRDNCPFCVTTCDGSALEEGSARLGWSEHKNGLSLRLAGPSPGGLVQALPRERSRGREAPLNDVVYQEMMMRAMKTTTGEQVEQLELANDVAVAVPADLCWEAQGWWCLPQEEAEEQAPVWLEEAMMAAMRAPGCSSWHEPAPVGLAHSDFMDYMKGALFRDGFPIVEALRRWTCGLRTPTSSDDEMLMLDAEELVGRLAAARTER
jgi:hypothetical protein